MGRLPSTTRSVPRPHASRRSPRALPAAPRVPACPPSRPATCWPRISPSSPRPTPPASCSARGCRSFSPHARIRCAPAWPRAPPPCSTPTRAVAPRPCRQRDTMNTVLVVNAGSSSVKFQIFEVAADGALARRIKGQMDGIATRPRLRASGADGATLIDRTYAVAEVADVPAALAVAGAWLRAEQAVDPIAVGHRVVHGGPDYD